MMDKNQLSLHTPRNISDAIRHKNIIVFENNVFTLLFCVSTISFSSENLYNNDNRIAYLMKAMVYLSIRSPAEHSSAKRLV